MAEAQSIPKPYFEEGSEAIRYEVRVGSRGTEYDSEEEARSAALELVFRGSVVKLITWADGRRCSLETGSLNGFRWTRYDIIDGANIGSAAQKRRAARSNTSAVQMSCTKVEAEPC